VKEAVDVVVQERQIPYAIATGLLGWHHLKILLALLRAFSSVHAPS
jgi:hypothetical protein